MDKFRGIGAAILGLSLACCASSAAAAPSPQKSLETMKKVAAAFERKDCDTVVRLGAPLIDARGGTGLPADIEPIAYDMVVYCESNKDMNEAAYAHALRGTALDHGSDILWLFRFAFEADADRHDSAVATVEAMAKGRGAALNGISARMMWPLDSALKEAGKTDLRRRLLAVLASDAWDPEDVDGPVDQFRLSYANMLVDSGDSAAARAVVAGFKDPRVLADAGLDLRLRAFLPAELDIRSAAEAQLARLREAMGLQPDSLRPLREAAGMLRVLGRPREAIELLRAASARIEGANPFADQNEHLSWYWDSLAQSHAMLGEYDNAIAALRKGAALSEGGVLNVSQVLNLAEVQMSFGRGGDALNTLKAFDDPARRGSPFGEMVLRYVRGCARVVAGRPAEAAEDVAYAKAHGKDHPGVLGGLLLCTGDMDGAAAAWIRRLDDPERRAAALLELSDFEPPVAPWPPHSMEAKLPALKARPDVQAAIQRAGGVRRFNVQADEL